MKPIIYNLFILIIFTLGCTNKDKSDLFTEKNDKELIDSLSKKDFGNNIARIDSILSENRINKHQKGVLLLEKGRNLIFINKDEKAYNVLQESILIFTKENNKKYLAKNYTYLGISNMYSSKKEKATEQLLKALDLALEIKDKDIEATIYNALSRIHYLYKDYPMAIDYIIKSSKIQIEDNDTLGLSATYNNLAIIYKNTGDLNNALKYNNNSLELNIQMNNQSAIAKSYNNLGQVSEQFNEYESAIKYYKKSSQINQKNKFLNSTSLRNLGALYLKNKITDTSKLYYLQALDVENKNDKISTRKDIYNVLLHISLKEKNFEDAQLYMHKRDSFNLLQNNIDNQEKLGLVENQYKLISSKKELEQEKKISLKNEIIFVSILGFILILGFYTNLKYRNTKLKLAEEKIRLEQKVLRSQMNPHFIFNALSAIQNSLLDNEPIKSATYLSRFAKLIRQNFDFINKKSISLYDEIDSLKNYMDTQKLRFQEKFDYEIKIAEDINYETVEIPPLLLQPFIENSIEHGFKNKKEKGKIEILIKKEKDYIIYTLKDNGCGFELNKKNNEMHAIDVFKKRMKLIGNKNENSFSINSNSQGTTINIKLKS